MRRVAVLLTLTGVLAACQAGGSQTGSAPAAGSPSIRLVSPSSGAQVASSDVQVKVEVSGVTLKEIGGANQPGVGHIHYYLDGNLATMSPQTEFTLKSVPPGEHTVAAELVQNDHSPHAGARRSEATIIIQGGGASTEKAPAPAYDYGY